MTLDEYKKLIVETSTEDWINIPCGAGSGSSYRDAIKGGGEFNNIEIDSHGEVLSLKKDLLVSVAWGMTHNDDFVEKWANLFPSSHASSSFVDFFYANQLVYRDIYVAVDGGRCLIPLPEIQIDESTHEIKELVVSKEKYKFFRLLNGTGYDYDRYFKRTGIEIIDKSWMD
ncbi:hypothetical protein MS2017_0642 [Bathymodiolus thermophilus thioautotrophic gill symbiont]|uniref:Uncharacterized protein n=1 Tax=Bathymodiolus thermophilus thioautotrophic gill symbiont TaxID=2360 RepID=A0A3G3IKK6_9GAMM|nr:hypothetical protein [Bathymodiolus thermophilus thioautotrophic gill symbiont]AYQ56376.1 hypothetical protein MS2017_0642 [Bathymodiolus thermophilus thioautotrophic gill symbiont]